MNTLSIDIYLSKGKIETLYLNDSILNESFGMTELKDKAFGLVGLSKIIVNLKTKKQILNFLKRNTEQLKQISKVMTLGFDPFEQKEPVKEPIPKDEPQEQVRKEERVSKSKMREMFEKIKQILISFLKRIKEKFSNFNITTDQILKAFETIYFILVKGIEISLMTILTYYFGTAVIAIFALVYILIILMNMIYIKRNNEEMSFNDAFIKSAEELVIMLRKFLTQLKVEKEEGYIAFLTFFLGIIIYKLKMLGLSGLFTTDISILSAAWFYLIFGAILLGTILYWLLRLFDRLPRTVENS
jgi:hypothetical protein